MDEKPIEKEQEGMVAEKKVYTPPTLTVYGKLTELTAGGTVANWEFGGPKGNPPPDPKHRP